MFKSNKHKNSDFFNPLSLILNSTKKEDSQKEKNRIKNEGIMPISNKKCSIQNTKEDCSLDSILKLYEDKNFSKKNLRKNLRQHLLWFHNVGFVNRKKLWYFN